MGSTPAFDFAGNWSSYSRGAGADRLAAARAGVLRLLPPEAWEGRRVLDLGCGSGLHATAIAGLGAREVVAVDVAPGCVELARANAERLDPEAAQRIRCMRADALDPGSLGATSPPFDIVYSWGVLHHTGRMWDAVGNALTLVRPGGTIVIALYNRHWSSGAWWALKWGYNVLWRPLRPVYAALLAVPIAIAKLLVTRRNPFRQDRGMSFWWDVVDWVGGYPYEFASLGEVRAFLDARGFDVERALPAGVPTGCNEFVARRRDG